MDEFSIGTRVRTPDGSLGTIADPGGSRNKLVTFGTGGRPAAALRPVFLDAGELRWIDESVLELV